MSKHPRRPKDDKQRQGLTVVTGWAGVFVGLVLFFTTLRSDTARFMPYLGVAIACSAYCVLVRPSISSNRHEIIVSNVLREVTLPWDGISHATSRGSLVIHDTEGHKTTVWGVGSRKARVERQVTTNRAGAALADTTPVPLSLPADSPQAMRESINAETIDNPDGPSGRVVRWLPLPCVLMTIAVVAVVVGLLQ